MKKYSSALCRNLTLALLSLTAVLHAQSFTGKSVTAVQYKPQRQPLDPRDLSKMQLVQAGQPLDPRQVAATIDRFFASGLYDDVQVDAEPSGSGVAITFITRSRPFIGHVDLEGQTSDPPTRSLLLSDAQLNLGTPFDQDALETAKKNLLQSFHDNGLYEASVDATSAVDSETEQARIHFTVHAGKRAKYEYPEIKGDTKLPIETIVRATGWRIRFVKRWRQVTQGLTDSGTDAIQKLYAKKDRLIANVDLTSLEYDPETRRLKPSLAIDAGPKISIKAEEAKIPKRKLRQYVPVYVEGAADNDLLAEGARNIRDYFQNKGYPDVDVTFKTGQVVNDEETITYYISKGSFQKLASVQIIGAKYFTVDTLHERMFLQPASFELRHGRYSEAFRKNDEQALENLYKANGFRDVKVTSTVQTGYKGKANNLATTFTVQEGKQWRIAKFQIEGVQQLDISSVVGELSAANGQVYSDVNIASDRNRLLAFYFSHGFPNATFFYIADPAGPDTVIVTYHISEGQREFVRRVLLSGLYRTKTSLVSRKVDMHDGEPLSQAKISEIARQLSELGVFAKINTAVQDIDGTNQYKYVLYDFDEAARYTFDFGIGAEIAQFGQPSGGLQNPAGKSGFSPRFQLDVNRLNFLGIGQTVSLQTRYSNIEQRASINYVVPRFLGSSNRTVTFSLLYDTTEDVTTFSSKRAEASVQTSQRLSKASTLLLRFAYRRVSTSNVIIPSLLIPQLVQPVRIGILSASYIQDHRDNPSDAHHGYYDTLDVGVAGGFFGSQRDFVRVLGRNATYTSIGKRFVFARQTQVGEIGTFKVPPGDTSTTDVPLPERFFGGGASSMRGFGYNEAGPRDVGQPATATTAAAPPTGYPLGGNALFFNTFELRFPLTSPNLSGVVFHDMGNVYTTLADVSLRFHQKNISDFNYAEQAVGFGVRYKTPLGPVRLDLAYALNPPRFNGYPGTLQDLILCANGKTPSSANACISSPQQYTHFQFFFSIGQAF